MSYQVAHCRSAIAIFSTRGNIFFNVYTLFVLGNAVHLCTLEGNALAKGATMPSLDVL